MNILWISIIFGCGFITNTAIFLLLCIKSHLAKKKCRELFNTKCKLCDLYTGLHYGCCHLGKRSYYFMTSQDKENLKRAIRELK